ncbi:hypothetical protein CYLTODRAFT_324105, partial [Cylindrobasidium torrendii FP15055 ss-10]
LLNVLSGGRASLDLVGLVKGNYSSDPLFGPVIQSPKDFRNFEIHNEALYLKIQQDIKLLCIPDIVHNTRKVREVVIDEAHSLLAHLGARKTLAYLRAHVWWKT